jgi:glycosyltransferase involved in cell wall biosynthesis
VSKIGFYLPNLDGGGAERIALVISAEFLKRGHQVDLILGMMKGQLQSLIPPGARVINLHAPRMLTTLSGLIRYLSTEGPDGLIATPDMANVIALWARLLSTRKTRVLIGNHIFLSAMVKNASDLRERLYPLFLNLFYRTAHNVFAVSKGAADNLAKRARIPRQRIHVVYNPIPYQEIVSASVLPCDHPWFASPSSPVILAAGRLTAQKDYPTLLNAFALIRKVRLARLIVLGEGKLRQELIDLSASLGVALDVDFLGFVHNPYKYMSRCQVFVLSSRYEGFGNVLVEALACGSQVVATDCPCGPAEILENGIYGRLTPVGDPKALAGAIEAALDLPLPADRLREHAQVFSVETAADSYLDLLGLS